MNLLMQHWSGAVPEIARLSSLSMMAYADRVGAEYVFFRGTPFDDRLTSPCQKLHALSEMWDKYEVVVQVDADMFATANPPNIFEERGVAWEHTSAHQRVMRHLPQLTSPNVLFPGGAIYRFDREQRQQLRVHYDYSWAKHFNHRGNGEDEGIVHRLMLLAGWTRQTTATLDFKWCWASYDPEPENGYYIHVRNHPKPKMEQYRELKAKSII